MKKRTIGLVAAATALGSMLVVAPAHAGPGDPVGCLQSPPGGTPAQEAVSVNGFDVTIRPDEIPGDVDSVFYFTDALSDGAEAYVWCVEGDSSRPVLCRIWSIDLIDWDYYPTYYVWQDYNGNIHIRGNELVADLTAPPCGSPI